jgi:Ca2+-transporting ATPase
MKTYAAPAHTNAPGDLLLLEAGDRVPADALAAEAHGLALDESSLTGESEPVAKSAESDPWIRSGGHVTDGRAVALAVAVGKHSEWGRVAALLAAVEAPPTPLQQKLASLAGAVGKVGATVAAACFVALFVTWLVVNKGFPVDKINASGGPVKAFLYAVTIVVVAIPEGLPLAVTISLAFSVKAMMRRARPHRLFRMLAPRRLKPSSAATLAMPLTRACATAAAKHRRRDNNFVRVLDAAETMGGVDQICSDKTGATGRRCCPPPRFSCPCRCRHGG